MKKIFLLSTVLLVVPVVALAQGFVPLAPIPGLTDVQYAPNGLAPFFNNLYKFAIGIAAALAVIQIIWAGLDIAIFHKDAVGAITDDKGKIYNAIFGLVLVLSPVLVFSIINPSILNLSLNLPELKTASGPPISTTPAPYVQESVKAGSTRAIYNGQLIGFQDNAYSSPQTNTYCIQLKDGSTPDGKNYFCIRDTNGCRMMFNDICKTDTTVVSCANGQGSAPKQQPCVKY